jgi:hypothetical protein
MESLLFCLRLEAWLPADREFVGRLAVDRDAVLILTRLRPL